MGAGSFAAIETSTDAAEIGQSAAVAGTLAYVVIASLTALAAFALGDVTA